VDGVIEEHEVRQLRHRFHLSGVPLARLCRTGASIAAPVHICEWQVMQRWVAGKPAWALVSTVAWQNPAEERAARPRPPLTGIPPR
jgi:hypothetical protein